MGSDLSRRISAEFLLVCAKGSPPVLARRPQSVILAARGAHSAVAGGVFDPAEQTSPGPYLEMLAPCAARLGHPRGRRGFTWNGVDGVNLQLEN